METLTLKSSKNRRSLLNTFAPLVKWELGTTKQEWHHICMPSATMSRASSKTTNPSSSSLARVLKKNDVAKRIFFQKSNKWDAARDVLQLEGRQQALHHCEREKRKYEKQNSEYYNSGIVDSRKKRKHSRGGASESQGKPPASNTSEVTGTNYEKMTIKELIQNIKSQNFQVKGISKLKKAELIDILMNSD